MTRQHSRRPVGRATDREVGVVAAVLAAGSEKAAAHRLGLSHSTVKHHLANARSKVGATTTAQLVWILGPRLPESEGVTRAGGPPRGGENQRIDRPNLTLGQQVERAGDARIRRRAPRCPPLSDLPPLTWSLESYVRRCGHSCGNE
jgi:DNA-binding CsgD family transcriptional regulator